MEKRPQPPAAALCSDRGRRKLQGLKQVSNTQVANATVVRMEIFISLQRVENDNSQWAGIAHKAGDEIQA